jgi:hypothetical protein
MRARCRSVQWLLVGVAAMSGALRCQTRIDLLTLRESEEIVGVLPQFRSSQEQGRCPGLVLLEPTTSGKIALQMRQFCLPNDFAGSSTIGNFEVDRSSGAVDLWPSGQAIQEGQEATNKARQLLARAKARVLSVEEAQCLAREAAKADSGSAEVAIAQTNRVAGQPINFALKYPVSELRGTVVWSVSVNPRSLAVLDGSNGQMIGSTEVADLLARMRTIREPPALSIPEAIRVALEVPGVTAQISERCAPQISADPGVGSLRLIMVEDSCGGYPRISQVVTAVDTLTGKVTDPRNRSSLDTPASLKLAQELLRKADERQVALKKEVARACSTSNQ